MAKIIFSLILFFFIMSCGKKGDIPIPKTEEKDKPAIIDKERIYKF